MKGVTTRRLSQRRARWKCNSGKDAGYLQQDEKTPEALLQLGIVFCVWIRSVAGRIWSPGFGLDGSANETPVFQMLYTNCAFRFCSLIGSRIEKRKTVPGGQFKWGACLRVCPFQYFSFFYKIRYEMKKKLCGGRIMGHSGYMREHLEYPKVPDRRVKIFWCRQSAGKSHENATPQRLHAGVA